MFTKRKGQIIICIYTYLQIDCTVCVSKNARNGSAELKIKKFPELEVRGGDGLGSSSVGVQPAESLPLPILCLPTNISNLRMPMCVCQLRQPSILVNGNDDVDWES